jgi:O-antigen ligase
VTALAHAGALLGTGGLAALLLARGRWWRLAGLAGWAVGLVALGLSLLGDESRTLLAAGAAGGVAVAIAGAAALVRWPWTLAFAILACAPLRVPLRLDGEEANLLLPLYGVVGALAAALAWQLLRGDARSRELGRAALPLAALVAWTGVTHLWSADVRDGSVFLGAFVLPFGLLAIGVARLPWSERALAWLWRALLALALAFAAVGLYQWATRDVFWNPKVIVGNAYAPFFRVNSVFWDPSVYGRFLVVAILAALALVLTGLRGRALLATTAALAATWAGLVFSFSQSSFAALVAGTLLAAGLAWRWRAAAALVALSVVVLAAGFATPQVRGELLDKSRSGLDEVTSDRASLVGQGSRIALDHPLVGVGVGGFKAAYAERTGLRGRDPARAASHTTPVTVAAETGFPGLALFLWLLAATLAPALRGLRHDGPSRAALVAGLTLSAIVVHSCFYNAFFEDPLVWALVGLAALAVARREATA